MPRRTAILLAAWVAAGVLSVGCAEPEVTVWTASEWTSLRLRTPRPRAPAPGAVDVDLAAPVNATAAFQVVIDGPDAPAGSDGPAPFTIEFTPLQGPDRSGLPAGVFEVYRMLPLRVRGASAGMLRARSDAPWPMDLYDPLVPVGEGERFAVSPQGRLALWVDARVPRGTAPGLYRGWMHLRGPQGVVQSLSIRLRVWAFVLPDTRPIAAVGEVDYRKLFAAFLTYEGQPYAPTHLDPRNPRVREGLVLLRGLMRLAHRHRLDLFESALRPVLKRDARGEPVLDWTHYDAIVSPYLDGSAFAPEDRIGTPAWPMPVDDAWPAPGPMGGREDRRYRRTFSRVAGACGEHFRSLNAGQQGFFRPLPDAEADDVDLQADLARLCRQADPNVPILSHLPFPPPDGAAIDAPAQLPALTDILAPSGRYLDPALGPPLRTPAHPLAGLWLRPGPVPYLPSIHPAGDAINPAALAWFADRCGATGLMLGDVLWSGDDPLNVDSADRAGLFYPGTVAGRREVLGSVRLKRLRRGLEDQARLWVLRRRGRDALAEALGRSLAHYAGKQAYGDHSLDARLDGWARDPDAWRDATRILDLETESAVVPSSSTPARRAELQALWDSLVARTRGCRIERVRTVLSPAGGNRWGLAIHVDVYNSLGRPAQCVVSADKLMDDWAPVEPVALAVAPRERATVILTSQGPLPALGPTGRWTARVTLRSLRQPADHHPCHVAALRAGARSRPIRIDGSLDDWPRRPHNAAGAFLLLGKRGLRPTDALPSQATSARVLVDDEAIYLAVLADESTPETIRSFPDNRVRYDELLARGEDLIEVVLDPGQRAQGPDDLYHLLVKAGGVVRATRGIDAQPPLGDWRDWSSGASVAVGRTDRGWLVEMRIPRSSFEGGGGDGAWGLNVARYRPRGDEASNWAGALRYYYDPRNLGTMWVSTSR
jgi:hypothetical protein